MENNGIVWPDENSHWQIKPVEVMRARPDGTWASFMYSVKCFLYPPYAVERIDVQYAVPGPKSSPWVMVLTLVLTILVVGLITILLKRWLKQKPPTTVGAPRIETEVVGDGGEAVEKD